MVDPRFEKTVLLLTHDNDEGSFALCINKTTGHLVKDVLDDSMEIDFDLDIPLYWGGPVNNQTLWILHDPVWRMPKTIQINQDWSMTSHISMLTELSSGNLPDRFRIMVGFSCWGPDQLEGEIQGHHPWRKEHSWLIARQPDPDWLFDQDESQLWARSIELSSSQAVNEWL